MNSWDIDASSIDRLACLLSGLREAFDAEVLDVRDGLDGGIVVDVRFDTVRAFTVHRTLVRERAGRTVRRD